MFFDILQQTINGLLVGSAYALVGLGFTLIWGVMARFNFAYGATALVGAYAVIGATQLVGRTCASSSAASIKGLTQLGARE